MEVSNKEAIAQQARSGIEATAGNDASSSSSTAKAITSLHQISVDQKDLSDLDKRVQDQDDLATAYGNWVDVVKVRQRAVAHEMLQSAMLILLVLFGVYLCNRLVDHFFVSLAVERTRLHTLRGVIRFAVQALGLVFDSAHPVWRAQPDVDDSWAGGRRAYGRVQRLHHGIYRLVPADGPQRAQGG